MTINLLLKTLCVISIAMPGFAQERNITDSSVAPESRFSDAIVFSRQKLTIDAIRIVEVPQPPAETTIEAEEGDEPLIIKEPEIEYEEQDVAYAFDVMVRPLTLVQPGSLQQLSWMKHDEGMMLVFEENDVISLADLGITSSVDILFIRPNGLIDAMAPDITPEQMSGDIETRKPVIAALLLKAGMAEHLKLKPGNQVNHKHFQPDTRVLR